MNHKNKSGGLHFCQSCWLRLSGFHHSVFKPRCLVFPFHELTTQAGLCLAPSHLPSRYPVKGGVVQSAAYLRSLHGISCPFCFDHGAGGGDEIWICHCALTARSQTAYSALCLSTRALWKIQPEFLETCKYLSILLALLLSGLTASGPCRCLFSTSSRPFHSTSSVFNFGRKSEY